MELLIKATIGGIVGGTLVISFYHFHTQIKEITIGIWKGLIA